MMRHHVVHGNCLRSTLPGDYLVAPFPHSAHLNLPSSYNRKKGYRSTRCKRRMRSDCTNGFNRALVQEGVKVSDRLATDINAQGEI